MCFKLDKTEGEHQTNQELKSRPNDAVCAPLYEHIQESAINNIPITRGISRVVQLLHAQILVEILSHVPVTRDADSYHI